jgi:hypothetical protein
MFDTKLIEKKKSLLLYFFGMEKITTDNFYCAKNAEQVFLLIPTNSKSIPNIGYQ